MRAPFHDGKGTRWSLLATALVATVLIAFGSFKRGAPPTSRPPLDPALRDLPLYFYPAGDSTRAPRAVVFFFGNDVGFWRPQQRLAWGLTNNQFAVVGFDLRALLNSLPADSAAAHTRFVTAILPIIARSRRELHGDSVPLIIAGHSVGAEIALWTAAYARPPGVVGVLAMSPGSRGHLRISMADLAMIEDNGPGSFALSKVVAKIATQERVAIIRGANDRFATADSGLLSAGGRHTRRFTVPLAGHSFKRILFVIPSVRQALNWMLER